jgi:acyl-CoA thioesterase-1
MKINLLTVLLFLAFSAAGTAQCNDSDYLKDFKEQLELKWPKNKTMNVVFHGHSVPSGYFTGGGG